MILGLTFIGLRASSAHQAAALSGMAQSVGYLLAACGPPLMGRIHDANGDWHIPLLAVALISLVMAVCGALAGPVFITIDRCLGGQFFFGQMINVDLRGQGGGI